MLQFLSPISPERLPVLLSAWCNTTKLIVADPDFVRDLGLYFVLVAISLHGSLFIEKCWLPSLCQLSPDPKGVSSSCEQLEQLVLGPALSWGASCTSWPWWSKAEVAEADTSVIQGIAGLWPRYLCSGQSWRPTISEDFHIFPSLLALVKQFPWDPLYPFVLVFFFPAKLYIKYVSTDVGSREQSMYMHMSDIFSYYFWQYVFSAWNNILYSYVSIAANQASFLFYS